MITMMTFEIRFFNVCAKTYKRTAAIIKVRAYDECHALKIVDRHPTLIKSIKKL